MNDELQKKLVEYLGSVEKMANDAVLFGKAEIPAYLKELIRWEVLDNAVAAGACLLAALAFVVVALRLRKNAEVYKNGDISWQAFVMAIFLVVAAILTIPTYFSARDAAKAYLAPRVLLVEKLSAMVRK